MNKTIIRKNKQNTTYLISNFESKSDREKFIISYITAGSVDKILFKGDAADLEFIRIKYFILGTKVGVSDMEAIMGKWNELLEGKNTDFIIILKE